MVKRRNTTSSPSEASTSTCSSLNSSASPQTNNRKRKRSLKAVSPLECEEHLHKFLCINEDAESYGKSDLLLRAEVYSETHNISADTIFKLVRYKRWCGKNNQDPDYDNKWLIRNWSRKPDPKLEEMILTLEAMFSKLPSNRSIESMIPTIFPNERHYKHSAINSTISLMKMMGRLPSGGGGQVFLDDEMEINMALFDTFDE